MSSPQADSFKPFISAETRTKEFSFRAIILGMVLGLVFGVGNAYLGLKIGTTVSASIPAAVMSMAILRLFFRNVSILENNLVQTIASVGEGLAGGVIFTVPALFLLGERIPIERIFVLAALGGVLGVLFMIPMRRYIIVQEHGVLPFPEGTACAEILKSGASSLTKAILAGVGLLTGALYRIFNGALYLWNEVPVWVMQFFEKTQFSIDATPSLLGVGYIIGPRICGVVLAGGAIGWWVLIPLIRMFAQGDAIIYPGQIPILQMTADDIWSNYIRYIGAGAVACGGILSLFKIGPLILKTLRIGFNELFQGTNVGKHPLRTDHDISLRWLVLGSIAIILTLWLLPGFSMNFLTILLLVVLGFFFVAVTSLTVGIVGSTSNPVSGMTITTLLVTCLIFVALGWTERMYLIAALTMGCVVNVAIALAGTTSQDLKTGFLLGATPRYQQIGEIIGVLLPALAIGGTLYLLDSVYGFGSPQMPAPQGTMMALIAKGVINGDIPVVLVVIGVILGLVMELARLPILPFAIGLYLPLSLSTSMMVGGIASFFVKKISPTGEAHNRGVLAASGLVAGDACMGVLIALFTVIGWIPADGKALLNDAFSLLFFLLLGLGLCWVSIKPPKCFVRR
ncbi:MAG: oligopeptide transporter, OPT family [Anaplasmataceae bacterium]|nr:oligopeptide transporter, OPT family [Anaplasmataceae bacterium]